MYGETFYGRHTAQHQLQWRQTKYKNKFLLKQWTHSKESRWAILRSFRYLILISDPVMTLQRKQEKNRLQFSEFQIGSRYKDIYIYPNEIQINKLSRIWV